MLYGGSNFLLSCQTDKLMAGTKFIPSYNFSLSKLSSHVMVCGINFQRLYNLDGQIGAEVLGFIKPFHAPLLNSRLLWAFTNLK